MNSFRFLFCIAKMSHSRKISHSAQVDSTRLESDLSKQIQKTGISLF